MLYCVDLHHYSSHFIIFLAITYLKLFCFSRVTRSLAPAEPKAAKDGMKQTKLTFKKKKRPGKEAWETDSEDEDARRGSSESEAEVPSPTRVREGGRRAAGRWGMSWCGIGDIEGRGGGGPVTHPGQGGRTAGRW